MKNLCIFVFFLIAANKGYSDSIPVLSLSVVINKVLTNNVSILKEKSLLRKKEYEYNSVLGKKKPLLSFKSYANQSTDKSISSSYFQENSILDDMGINFGLYSKMNLPGGGTFDISAGMTSNDISSNLADSYRNKINELKFNFIQPLFKEDYVKTEIFNAEKDLDNQKLNTDFKKRSKVLATVYYFFSILKEINSLSNLQKSVEYLETVKEVTNTRLKYGEVSERDVLRISSQVNALQAQINTDKIYLAYYKKSLNDLMEIDYSFELEDIADTNIVRLKDAYVITDIIKNDYLLKKYYNRLDILKLTLENYEKSMKPELRFETDYSLKSNEFLPEPQYFYSGEQDVMVKLVFNYDFWDGDVKKNKYNSLNEDIRSQELAIKEYEKSLKEAADEIIKDFENSSINLQSNLNQIKLVQKEKRITEILYKNGEISIDELLNTYKSLTESEMKLTHSIYEYNFNKWLIDIYTGKINIDNEQISISKITPCYFQTVSLIETDNKGIKTTEKKEVVLKTNHWGNQSDLKTKNDSRVSYFGIKDKNIKTLPEVKDLGQAEIEEKENDLNNYNFIRFHIVYYEINQINVLEKEYEELKKLYNIFKKKRNAIILIESHTDAMGDSEINLELSKERAVAAQKYLEETFNIAGNKIFIKYFGETKPISMGTDLNAYFLNRRTEFFIGIKSVNRI